MQAEEYIEAIQKALSSNDELVVALVYGSVAEHEKAGRFGEQSDIDLGIISRNKKADKYSVLKSLDLDRKVDLVDLQNINPTLGMQIIKNHKIILMKDEQKWDKWVMKTLSMYNDLQIENKTLVEDLGKYSPLD